MPAGGESMMVRARMQGNFHPQRREKIEISALQTKNSLDFLAELSEEYTPPNPGVP